MQNPVIKILYRCYETRRTKKKKKSIAFIIRPFTIFAVIIAETLKGTAIQLK
jgi:hypothetical protein